MKRHHIYHTVLGLAVAALALTACSDEWNDHYEGQAIDVKNASLWEAIQKDGSLSNFASVVQACGYDKALGSSQVFTVFAPTNDCFSSAEAQALIQQYNAEKGKVNDNENTTIKEFLQNHIALYNHSISKTGSDSIVMMNGKYALLTPETIGGSRLLTTNQHYGNGVLFTLGQQVAFYPNVFEYMRKDNDLDSIRSFFYNEMFYRSVFDAEESVPGGIVDGKTVYLDSVFHQQNELFNYDFMQARLNSEDSTYWMVMPTNRAWRDLIDEYTSYFNYDNTVNKRDSIIYTNSRMAIVKGTAFSRTFNSDATVRDSARSTNCVLDYNRRKNSWGADSLHYFQYYNPYQAGGIFSGTTNVNCSNGVIMKADEWHFDKTETFFQTRIIEAEARGAIKEVSMVDNPTKGTKEETISPRIHYVEANNSFYNKVSNNGFVEFEQAKTTVNHSVTFNITDVLSNIGYDIYLVTAPALAADSTATAIQRLPNVLRCTLSYNDQDAKKQENRIVSSVENNPDIVDYILLAEDFKFPVCSYGLNEDQPQVTLTVETRVTSTQQRNNTHSRTMRIDCIILKPHVQ